MFSLPVIKFDSILYWSGLSFQPIKNFLLIENDKIIENVWMLIANAMTDIIKGGELRSNSENNTDLLISQKN